MKLVFVLAVLAALAYTGFQISTLDKGFHKQLVRFIKRWKYVLLILVLFGIGVLIWIAHYTSAFDRYCVTSHTPTVQPPIQLKTSADFLQQGDYEYERGNCLGALADYSQAIVRNLSDAVAYNNRAYTNMRLRNYAFALMDLNRAISLRPGYTNALTNRGDIYNYYYHIDKQKAIADYNQVVASGRTDANGSICGHRAVAIYGSPGHIGWNIMSFIPLFLLPRTYGCTMPD